MHFLWRLCDTGQETNHFCCVSSVTYEVPWLKSWRPLVFLLLCLHETLLTLQKWPWPMENVSHSGKDLQAADGPGWLVYTSLSQTLQVPRHRVIKSRVWRSCGCRKRWRRKQGCVPLVLCAASRPSTGRCSQIQPLFLLKVLLANAQHTLIWGKHGRLIFELLF